MRVLAIDPDGVGPSPFGRLVMVNLADQSRYFLMPEGEIVVEYRIWE